MHLQQTHFENITTNGEITQNEQYLLLLQHCFHFISMIKLLFIKIFHIFAFMLSKLSAADLLYVGKDEYLMKTYLQTFNPFTYMIYLCFTLKTPADEKKNILKSLYLIYLKNIVGDVEIAHHEQILLFQVCLLLRLSNLSVSCVRESVNVIVIVISCIPTQAYNSLCFVTLFVFFCFHLIISKIYF